VPDSTPPRRLLDPHAPTPPRLRALLAALRPGEPTDEADQRIEERIFETLAEEPAVQEHSPRRRSAG